MEEKQTAKAKLKVAKPIELGYEDRSQPCVSVSRIDSKPNINSLKKLS